MRINKIVIKNFKGIRDVTLDLSKHPNGKFYTFVGLNESGKTTILEAISNFCYGKDPIITSKSETLGKVDYPDMIPIFARGNFNDTISISFTVSLSQGDHNYLLYKLKEKYSWIKNIKTNNPFSVRNEIVFSDSKFKPSPRIWDLDLEIREDKKYSKFKKIGDARNEIWQDSATILQDLFPDIIYFPSSIFDFPGRIYIDAKSSQKDIFYSKIIQDVLNSLNRNYDLKKHVLDRMKANDESSKKYLRAVLKDLSNELTRTIIENWRDIFPNTHRNGPKFVVNEGSDASGKDGQYYLDFSIDDGNGLSGINERSLGFRWFFVFRLLTYYRGCRYVNKEKNILFLLDEPASNLHQSAQQKLLSCFENLPQNCYVFYTTHSHHLINPKWVDNIYIVKNNAINYDLSDWRKDLATDITLTRYKKFIADNPNETTYFQPILDVLDYKPSNLECISNALLVEGKNDFYTLELVKRCLGINYEGYQIVPSSRGCGGMDTLISLYLGWGKEFILLLDSDKKIDEAIQHYIKEWGEPIRNKIYTINNLLNRTDENIGMEKMFSKDDLLAIVDEKNETGNPIFTKNKFNRAIQELLMSNRIPILSDYTKNSFKKLFYRLTQLFGN